MEDGGRRSPTPRRRLTDFTTKSAANRLPASGSAGFRTFSTNRVIAERAGEWKVELRSADGSVLHEEHFVVR